MNCVGLVLAAFVYFGYEYDALYRAFRFSVKARSNKYWRDFRYFSVGLVLVRLAECCFLVIF